MFLGLFVVALWVYASTKPNDGDGDDDGRVGRAAIRSVEDGSATNDVRTLTDEDFSRGLVLTRVGTNETFDFSAPAEAVVCEDWKNFGAAEDWFYLGLTNWGFKVAENEINWFKIFSNGLIEFSGESRGDYETQSADRALQVNVTGNDLKAGASGLLRRYAPRNDRLAGDVVGGGHSWLAEYCSIDECVIGRKKWIAPFCASLGILPESKWDMLAGMSDGANVGVNTSLPSGILNQPQSCFWHCVTPSNTLQLTWRNVLLWRYAGAPVSFQTELWQNGRLAFRYNLANIGDEEVSNILAGALIGDAPFCMNALPRNVTSIEFYPLTEEDAVNPDRDEDGLSIADELFVHRTDPELYDTDLDGLSDGEEIAAGTNPLLRDTDGDGLVDGSDLAPLEATSFTDFDGDGIPDEYEIHWLGGTNVVDDASVRDETGFTLLAKMAAGINPTNGTEAVNVISSGHLASWKLFEPFGVELPAGTTNLVWERTFAINRTSAWQQFFISSSPSNAAPWRIENATLEWTTNNGDSATVSSGSVAASPFFDSYRIPLEADDFSETLTLRIRATGSGMVQVPKALYLIGYAPEFKVEGGTDVTGESGAKFSVFMKGTKSSVSLKINHSNRPHKASVELEECDFAGLQSSLSVDGNFMFEGDAHGGTIKVLRPGVCELQSCTFGVGSSSGRRSTKGAHSAKRIVVLDPSVRWSCYSRDCLHAGLQYSWETDEYGENDGYPLDSKCLRKKWHSSWTGVPLHDNCELNVISGAGNADWVSVSTDGNTGKIKIDGVEVWSESAEHFYGNDWCSGGYEEGFLDDDAGCGGCETDCADGNCDSLEGATLGSLKFRIPLGNPVKGQVAGFVWFATDEPIQITSSAFQLLAHPDAHISDTTESGVRRIVCSDARGRDLRIEDIANGVKVTIRETDSQKLEHTWEITNSEGNTKIVRLRKISRQHNVMSDETYTYRDGDWTRFDIIAGAGTDLVVDYGPFEDERIFKRETRTTTDAHGKILKVVTVEMSRFGECDNAVLRETKREESTGNGTIVAYADYWDDPQHSARHGQPRLVYGNSRGWVYTDYDKRGRETLRLEQRGNASMPSQFPFVVSNELRNIDGIGNAIVTVRSFEPFEGDSGHLEDSWRPRIETQYVVTNGVESIIGRTWYRYTQLVCDGYDAVKCEKWRAYSRDADRTDEQNAYSHEVRYSDTGADTPFLMRNVIAEAMDENGILTQNTQSLTNGVLAETSRKSYNGNALPVYSVTERDAVYGNVVRRTERLTENDAIIADEQSVYDEKNRLRSTTYLNGTSITNHYSCCRLLWKRDREGRKMLRSAKTGSDHLYYAMEDVWLGEISTNRQYRITQHFFDALGRETNTVTYTAMTQGEAEDRMSSNGMERSIITTEYPNGGSGYSVTRDERGKVTERFRTIEDDCISDLEIVYTNGVEAIRTKTRNYHGGGTSIRKEWDGKFTEERRFDEYNPEGCRISYAITESSDYGLVTNSVSEYDLLGRIVSSEGPLGITEYTYDGFSTRISGQTVTSGPIMRNATMFYNEYGEQVGVMQDGVTSRTDTEYEIDSSNVVWRVTTERTFGEKTNACVATRVRMTKLSDACRAETVRTDHSGKWSRTTRTFDAESGLETETIESSEGNNSIRTKKYGIVLQTSQSSGVANKAFDALGRIVQETHSAPGESARRVMAYEYAPNGDLMAAHTSTNANDVVSVRYGYDCLGYRIETVDAFGNATHREYDVFGNVVEERGTTYPVRYEYDTQNRMISLATTHDGVAWDVTRWIYDGATGLCKKKIYANGSEVNYSHTPDGLPLRTTYAGGRWFENVYNEKRELAGVVTSGGDGDASYLRDEFGLTISEVCNSSTIHYSHAEAGIATNEFWSIAGATSFVVRLLDSQGRIAFNNGMLYRYADDGKLSLLSNEIAQVEYLYSSDGHDAGCRLTLANGNLFERRIVRDQCRRELITGITSKFNRSPVETLAYSFDALGRSVTRNTDTFGYNQRSELIFAAIDSHTAHYAYDHIGNCRTSILNGSVTNNFLANCLNQYTSQLCLSAAPRETAFSCDADGNLLSDGIFAYTYDFMNRLKTVSSNGIQVVENFYDAKSRRIKKETQSATHTFIYDDWNLIEERVESTSGEMSVIKYYWGKDVSGTIQGAGGIGGLLYLTIEGQVYIPCYDNNGNITKYLDASGNIVGAYTYDAFGKTISQSGVSGDFFRYRFSTKYYDVETGLYYYGFRFYHPVLMRWLNRDPMNENGGINLYGFCGNNPIHRYDPDGRAYFALRKLKGFVWLGPLSHNLLFDVLNIEIAHELVFLEDNGDINDFGYSEEGVGQEKAEDIRDMTYYVTDGGYNDCVMRKAIKRVPLSGDDYSAFWMTRRVRKLNCQDYCSALRREYNELIKKKEVRCECGIK